MNDVINLLQSHRSIRRFADKPIGEELFRSLLEAGQSAATSSHVQATTVIRVREPAHREAIAELAGGQPYIASCSEFLVFCADMKRVLDASERAGAAPERGMTEQFIIATVDTALFAQNVAVAAESAGLGICYIGGIRNNPARISELLELPRDVYPVFGFCIGHPEQDPEVKPRLPLDVILKEDRYHDDGEAAAIDAFDATMRTYYQRRGSNQKASTWSGQVGVLFSEKTRPHMRDFLHARGFIMK
ncbi:oxygen-insensitive NADPH nitroreductase [Aquisalimonas lutea]|uniref:oxygen-insensitive NADPH nitroreductase n=1 Tax=Aquisalimonas lutea TaxID=1327750 RepID=UPI0025B40FC9|nr:oxygen-insensitive NADPH nitroreductase [Aquisalimonas lutea]MDN3516539.1 oxygen-insensitive NADPH nitroreductase [Aquisalimonas lutea]